jgi:hypothetical protein
MPGFGGKPFGSGEAGDWAWATAQLWDNLPEVYKEQDAEAGGGRLQGLLEVVAPVMTTLHHKIRDLSDLKDPLIAPTNHTFSEPITIIGVDDLKDGTSRVFISQGVLGDKYKSIKPGYTLTDYSGTKFAIIEIHSSALVTDVPVAPTDPATALASGKHVIVENISLGTSYVIPLISGTKITAEVPAPITPANNGINVGPYTFATSVFPAKNIVTVRWTVGGTQYFGSFNSMGLRSGDLQIGSTINWAWGPNSIQISIGYNKVADAGSITVDYTSAVVPITDPSIITADNLLAFLGNDLGALIDRHDSETLQRSFVYHSFQLWDLKGTYDGYYYMGRISGYVVDAHFLYRVDYGIWSTLPNDHAFEIPSGSGHYYTDLPPGQLLYDEVIADVMLADTYDFEGDYPSVAQSVTVTLVEVVRIEGTQTRYKVTVTGDMHKSFGTTAEFTDGVTTFPVVEKFTRTSNSTYTFEVVSTASPLLVPGTVTWKVFKVSALDPDFTIGAVETIGLQYNDATGVRYAITHNFGIETPIASVGSWAIIDANGIISYLESIVLTDIITYTYRMEFVSPQIPAGDANIFYIPGASTSCRYCRASALRFLLTPAEVLLDTVSMSEDSLGRLITRLEQMIPAHIRAVDYVYSIGPSIAPWSIVSSTESMITDESAAPMAGYFDITPLDDMDLDAALFSSTSTTEITTLNVFEEFLTGVDPLLFGGWTATGLWHVTQYRSSTQFKSFNYGQNDVGRLGEGGSVPPDFNTGAATTGSLISPVITAIAAATSVTLRFRHYGDVEAGVIKDLPTVYVKSSPANVVLATFNKAALALDVTGNTGGIFVTITQDIKAAVVGAGNFYVEFVFDSVDNLNNTTEGWYVDDIEVQVIP